MLSWSKPSQGKSERDVKEIHKFDKGNYLFLGGIIVSSGIMFTFSKSYREWFIRRNSAFFAAVGALAGGAWILYERMTKPYFVSINEIKFAKFTNHTCRGHIYGLTDCTERQSQDDPTFSCSFAIMR